MTEHLIGKSHLKQALQIIILTQKTYSKGKSETLFEGSIPLTQVAREN